MRVTAGLWFGIALGAGLLFLWALMRAVEAGLTAGPLWGMILTGIVGLGAAAMAIAARVSAGPGTGARDLVSPQRAPAPRGAAGRTYGGPGYRPEGSGEVPRPAAGRHWV